MKTIGDFREAGLEISKNDVIDGVTRDKNSAPLKLVELLNKDYDFNDAWTIREFSWRENTGEKPSFEGIIEWHSKVGTKHEGHIKNIDGTLVSKWRPLLNQEIPTETPEEKAELDRIFGEVKDHNDILWQKRSPEETAQQMLEGLSSAPEKPIYTQAMFDAGERPQVGMDVDVYTDSDKDHVQRGNVVHTGQSFGKIRYVVQCQNWLSVFDLDWFLPIDTRSPEDKAVASIMLYGCQKLTPSQSKEILEAIKDNKIHGVKWVGQ